MEELTKPQIQAVKWLQDGYIMYPSSDSVSVVLEHPETGKKKTMSGKTFWALERLEYIQQLSFRHNFNWVYTGKELPNNHR